MELDDGPGRTLRAEILIIAQLPPHSWTFTWPTRSFTDNTNHLATTNTHMRGPIPLSQLIVPFSLLQVEGFVFGLNFSNERGKMGSCEIARKITFCQQKMCFEEYTVQFFWCFIKLQFLYFEAVFRRCRYEIVHPGNPCPQNINPKQKNTNRTSIQPKVSFRFAFVSQTFFASPR